MLQEKLIFRGILNLGVPNRFRIRPNLNTDPDPTLFQNLDYRNLDPIPKLISDMDLWGVIVIIMNNWKIRISMDISKLPIFR